MLLNHWLNHGPIWMTGRSSHRRVRPLKRRAGYSQSRSDQYAIASRIESLENRLVLSAISESAGMAEFQVALTTPSSLPVTVKYVVAGGTATGGGADFTLANGTVKFNANETVKTVRFPIINDTRDEADETIRITLSAPSNATLATLANSVINVTILDDDAPPRVSFSTTASTGSESVAAPKLTVALAAASGQIVTVPYTVSGGNATSGIDFTLANGSLTFAPGQTTQTIGLAILNDLRHEDAETIVVTLGTPTNALLGTNTTHTYTIQDNDAVSTLPQVTFVSATATATEPAAKTSVNLPAVQLSSAPAVGKNATVKYTVTGGSATSGSDFTLAAGTLTFTSTGSLTQVIPISLLPDSFDEADETVRITLSAPSNALLGAITTTTLTLQDDADAPPTVAFQVSTSTIKEAVKTASLIVTLAVASGQPVTVPYSVSGGSATGGGVDFTLASGTLTFAPGKTTATIPLTIVDDKLNELNETIQVTLGTPANATLGANVAHTLSIQDDDPLPKVGFKAATSSVSEKLGLDVIPVVLSAATSQTVTINYAVTTGGTASATDYALPAGTLTFAPGETTKNIFLSFVDDGAKESNETVKISLTMPDNATLGTVLHTATITDGGTLPSVTFVAATSSGSEAIGQANVAVALSAPTSKVVTINYSAGGTATSTDFSLPSNSVTFQPGETLKNIPITIFDDKRIDPKETILLTLAVPLNATLGVTKLHTFTIQDNDPLVGFDAQPPIITVTSPTNGLRVNSNVTVTGQATDDFSGVKNLQANVDGGAASNISVDANGFWGLTTSLPLNQTADGPHVVVFQATDVAGRVSAIASVSFVLDTTPPVLPTLSLSPTSDTGTAGDGETAAARATLVGQTEPQAAVVLVETGATTIANASGTFQFSNVSLAIGQNTFTVRVVDDVGNAAQQSAVITRVDEPLTGDVVLDWNSQTLAAIQRDADTPPEGSRVLAMESLAVFDVVSAFDGSAGFYVSLPVPAGASLVAAVAGAAERILSHEFPAQHSLLSEQLATTLSDIPDGDSETNGLQFGRDVAAVILAARANDGHDDFVDYVSSSGPGAWQTTSPMFAEALLPQWADLQPFAMTSPSQFRPEGPPALDSAAYAQQLNEVKDLGKATGSTRTPDQTAIARFWADGPGTITPPGHWNDIAATVARQQGNSVADNARLFAQLNVALADAAIVAWDAKYATEFWRPITAIRAADTDGNAATVEDATWTPLLITPPFPEYVSGHSTFSGAAAAVLTSVFGADVGFTSASPGFLVAGQPVQRTFTNFEEAANEAGRSRIFGGIHFQEANQDGLAAGQALANFVMDTFGTTADTQAPRITISAPPDGVVTATNVTIEGRVIDNLVGVKSLVVYAARVQDPATPITPDSTGNFTFLTTFPLDGTADGPHVLNFQATDHAGNISNLIPLTINLDTRNPIITLTSPLANAEIDETTLLTGKANGTGSPITSLCYAIDTGMLIPLSFDPTTGDFSTSLDLSKISAGSHTLKLQTSDAAGHVTTLEHTIQLASLIPFTITDFTPSSGEDDVGVTFRPQVFFSRPVNPTSLTSNNFFATDTANEKLPANIVVADDGSFAWLFLNSPMPGGSTITLHVDGTTIFAEADAGGPPAPQTALDADGDGEAGGVFTTTFTTVSLAPLPGTSLAGKIVGPGLDLVPMTFDDIRVGPDGVLHTADDVFLNPIAHVKVFVLGFEDQAVFTDSQGLFHFNSVPAGHISLAVDGRTATNVPAGFFYPEMVSDLDIQPGQANTVMGTMGVRDFQEANLDRPEMYLPLIQESILTNVSTTEPTTVGVDGTSAPNLTPEQQSQLRLVVQPGSLIGPDGQPVANGQVGVSMVPPEFVRDMLPEELREGHTMEITIQAPGTATFSTPIQITFPNTFGAAPGSKLTVLSFDHTTGLVVPDGTATVSADGLTATSDPDSGIRAPGWHFIERLRDYINRCLPRVVNQTRIRDFTAQGLAIIDDLMRAKDDLGRRIADATRETGELVQAARLEVQKFVDAGRNPLEKDNLCRFLINNLNSIETIAGGLLIQMSTFLRTAASGYQAASLLLEATTRACQDIISRTDCYTLIVDVLCFGIDTVGRALDLAASGLRDYVIPAVDDLENQLGAAVVDILIAEYCVEDAAEPHNAARTAALNAEHAPTSFMTENTDASLSGSVFDGLSNLFAQTSVIADEVAGVAQEADRISTTYINPERSFYLLTVGNRSTRGTFDADDTQLGELVLAGSVFDLKVYDPVSERFAFFSGTTSTPGNPTEFPPLAFVDPEQRTDTDSDGLLDLAEHIIGTSQQRSDTDRDGIDDFTEVAQGLDPLGGRAIPTGVIATQALNGEAKAVVVKGSTTLAGRLTAFVATGSNGLAIVDASQFDKPALLSQLALSGDSSDLDVDSTSNVAVVASNGGGLHFIDVSDSARPKRLRTADVLASQVEVIDGIAYAAVASQIVSYEALTGDLFNTLNIPNGAIITGMTREGGVLYTMDANRNLRAFEITDTGLDARGSVQLTHGGGRISVSNGVVYAAARPSFTQGGFATANVSNSNSLVEISASDVAGGFASPGDVVVANGSGLALLGGQAAFGPAPAIDVMDVRDPANTDNFVTQFNLPAPPLGIAIASGIGYVADGTGGLQVINYVGFDRQGQAPTATIRGPVGGNLQEGSIVPIRVSVTDDVQVRNVELLMNGQVVVNDVSAPFDLSAIAPTLASGATTVAFQVRATDTGGNVGLSNTLTYNLTTDITPPVLIGSSPTDDGAGFRVNTVTLRFNEPIDATRLTVAGVTLTNFGANSQLGGGDDSNIIVTEIESPSPRRVVIHTDQPLGESRYQLTVNPSILADLAGNSVAAPVAITFTSFDSEAVNGVAWISNTDGDWNNPGNWSTGKVPGPDDTVIIDRKTANVKVRLPSGNVRIQGLTSREEFIMNGGSLTVTKASRIDARFEIGNGSTLTASGPNARFTANSITKIDGGSFIASNGGQILLPAATSYDHAGTGNYQERRLQASGSGSVLDLSNVTSVINSGAHYDSQIHIQASDGGSVDLRRTTLMQDTANGDNRIRAINVTADGPTSVVNLSSLVSFRDVTAYDDADGRFSSLNSQNGGTITVPALTTLVGVSMTLDGESTLSTSQITSFTNGRVVVSNSLTLGVAIGPAGTDADARDGSGNAVNLVGTASNSGATTLAVGSGTLQTFDFNTFGGIDRTSGFDRGDLSRVIADQMYDGSTLLLDLNNNGSFSDETAQTGFGMHSNRFITFDLGRIRSDNGLPADEPFALRGTAGTANNANTNMSLMVLLDGAALVVHDVNDTTSAAFAKTIPGGGRYLTFVLLDGTDLDPFGANGGFANVRLIASVDRNAPQNFAALTDARGSQFVINGATVNLSNVTNLSQGSVTLNGGGTADLSRASNIDGASFFVNDGVTLALPAATSYDHASTGDNQHRTFRASGTGSVLNLSNVTSVLNSSIHYDSRIFVEALDSGRVDLRRVTQMQDTSSGDQRYRAISVTADGPTSVVNLSSLVSFRDAYAFDDGDGLFSSLNAQNGGTITVPALTTLVGVSMTLDGESTLSTSQITSFTNGRVVVSNSLTLGVAIGPAGTDADARDGSGNAVNLVGTASNSGATTLAVGSGTLPTFDFNTFGGIDRTSGFVRGDLLRVIADQKHDGSTLLLDLNNNGSFSDETAQTGFGMTSNRFITFDLGRIRSDNGLPADEPFALRGTAGPANANTNMSLMVLLDGAAGWCSFGGA